MTINQIKYVVIALVIIIMAGVLNHLQNKNRELKTQLLTSQQNNAALKDSLRKSINKAGEIEYSKLVMVGEKKLIEENNAALKKELTKSKSKIFELTQINASIKNKNPIELTSEDITPEIDSTYNINWKYKDEYRLIEGITNFKLTHNNTLTNITTTLKSDITNLNIMLGLRNNENNDLIEVYAYSNNSDFSVNGIQSAIINPQEHPILQRFTKPPKKLHLSLYSGYGYTYSFNDNNVYNGFQIGVGLTYNIF